MNITEIIKSEFQLRVIDESLARIIKCIEFLSLEEIWHKPNLNSNAMGNLILHLEGNIRQYILAGVGGAKDIRSRDSEFSNTNTYSKEKLISLLTETLTTANEKIVSLSENQLIEKVIIQGFDHTRLSAIVHVIEHLSYHTGQITFYTKLVKNIDTGYYAGLDLDITG